MARQKQAYSSMYLTNLGYLPLTLINQKDILGLLIIVIALLMLTDIKIKLRDLFMFGGLVILALMSRRQISMLILIGMPNFG